MMKSLLKYILPMVFLAGSCARDKDLPIPEPQRKTIHYAATVAEGEATRAELGEDMKYRFEHGDRIYMESENGEMYGFLSLSSAGGEGKSQALFEGDLSCEEGFTPTSDTPVYLTLLSPADELHTVEEGKVTGVNYSNKCAVSLQEAVRRLSHFTGTGQFGDLRFTIGQKSTFLMFNIRMSMATVPQGTPVTVSLLESETPIWTADVSASQAGKAGFVAAFEGGRSLSGARLSLSWTDSESSAHTQDFALADKTLAANNYYNISRTTGSFDGFRIKAAQDNTQITFNYTFEDSGLEYSLDGGESWTGYTYPFTLNADEEACIRGQRDNYKNDSGKDAYGTPADKPIFLADKKCYIAGNIMSLLYDEENLSESAFHGAFSRGTGTNFAVNYIDIDPTDPLILPATTLARSCYQQMFRNCTSLTTAPTFTVEGTAYRCCYNMFRQCSNLVDVSGIKLPAQNLSEDCYRELVRQCTKLTTAPVLPARTLVKSCYQQMFSACSALTSVTCLATDITAPDCTNNWMGDVPNNQTVPRTFYVASEEMKSTWSRSISGILSNWKVEVYSE